MTTPLKFSPDDPKLTAYALGELEGEDLAAVEAALRDDAAALAAVAEIRATASQLQSALLAEPVAPATGAPRTDPYVRKGKLLRFPQIYYLAGGLAAAAFAVLVAYRGSPERRDRAEKMSFLEVNLQSKTAADGRDKKAEPASAGLGTNANSATNSGPATSM